MSETIPAGIAGAFTQGINDREIELTSLGNIAEATDHPMEAWGATLAKPDGTEYGIWKCSTGPSRWEFTGISEFIYITEGRIDVTPDDGEPFSLVAGDTALFPKGWKGNWDIAETVRKIYVIF